MGTTIFWIIAVVVFAVLEAFTASLTSIWFGIGALGALLAHGLGASPMQQATVFIILSALSLLLLRPMAKKMLHLKFTPTNADRILGTTAIVTEEIDNIKGTGLASISGQIWTARTTEDSVIAIGTEVTILKIEGVKIIVTKK